VQEAWKAGATKCLSKASCTPKQLLSVTKDALKPAAKPAAKPESEVSSPDSETSSIEAPDIAGLAELRAGFLDSLPSALTVLRAIMQGVVRAPNEQNRLAQLNELHAKFHLLSSNAGVAGLKLIAGFGEASEALTRQLIDKPVEINASTLRTLAGAVDFVGWLFEYGTDPEKQNLGTPKLLVVDDDPLSRRAVCNAVEKVKLTATSLEDPLFAIKMAAQTRFDLIILDVDMPGMNGFELCSKLRATQMHKGTPIVFVTGLSDFESRANSTISGGNDLIAKPFLFMELALKALMHVIRGRLTVRS
jgi:CheY-like chemotaxis protein